MLNTLRIICYILQKIITRWNSIGKYFYANYNDICYVRYILYLCACVYSVLFNMTNTQLQM